MKTLIILSTLLTSLVTFSPNHNVSNTKNTFSKTYTITSINTQTGEYYGTSTTDNNGIYFDNSIEHPNLTKGDTIKVTFEDTDDNIINVKKLH